MSWRTSDVTRLWLRKAERNLRASRPVAAASKVGTRILSFTALLSRPPLWNVVPRSSAPSVPPPPAVTPSAD
jgi:hypothetical protein